LEEIKYEAMTEENKFFLQTIKNKKLKKLKMKLE
jgi:hypothetical protein